ncbi:allergen Tha p 1-like [Tribolium madens]|uniref:allergen Tha p 1-like n=1 Tax=Tribolium madens TaxID=41895 RepID=UPI001CF7482C|nr:allergen Tha p 1-like [Tribolium madens]
MRFFVIFFIACVSVALARPEEQYTIKYDNVNLKEILQSDRLTENYVNCLLDKKPCTPDGEELKRVLPDALKTSCSKCTDKQKQGARTVIQHLYKNKQDWWKQLEAKYDPEHTYVKAHEDELKAL